VAEAIDLGCGVFGPGIFTPSYTLAVTSKAEGLHGAKYAEHSAIIAIVDLRWPDLICAQWLLMRSPRNGSWCDGAAAYKATMATKEAESCYFEQRIICQWGIYRVWCMLARVIPDHCIVSGLCRSRSDLNYRTEMG